MRRHLLPLMRQHDVDPWVILSHENAPDPLVELFGGYGVTGSPVLASKAIPGAQPMLLSTGGLRYRRGPGPAVRRVRSSRR